MHRKIIWTLGASTFAIGALVVYQQFVKRGESLVADRPDVRRQIATGDSLSKDPISPAPVVSDELMSRVESSFRDVYLQLNTIIQGVAFGVLAATGIANLNNLHLAKWFALLTCLTAILIIWHEYMIGATAFAWVPTILDTIIPFSLGLAEFAMIAFAVGSTQGFLAAVAAAWLTGVVAHGNFWFHARRGLTINRTSYPLLHRYIRFGFLSNSAGFIVVLILLGLSRVYRGDSLNAIYAGCTFATTVPVLFRSVWQWNFQLKRHASRG